MSKTVTHPFDVAEYLRTPDDRAAYLDACIEEANGDAAFVGRALGDIARAKGIEEVARTVGLPPDVLLSSLSGDQSPDFGIFLKVLTALGLELKARSRAAYGDGKKRANPA